jgi:hypothetical protein
MDKIVEMYLQKFKEIEINKMVNTLVRNV